MMWRVTVNGQYQSNCLTVNKIDKIVNNCYDSARMMENMFLSMLPYDHAVNITQLKVNRTHHARHARGNYMGMMGQFLASELW